MAFYVIETIKNVGQRHGVIGINDGLGVGPCSREGRIFCKGFGKQVKDIQSSCDGDKTRVVRRAFLSASDTVPATS